MNCLNSSEEKYNYDFMCSYRYWIPDRFIKSYIVELKSLMEFFTANKTETPESQKLIGIWLSGDLISSES